MSTKLKYFYRCVLCMFITHHSFSTSIATEYMGKLSAAYHTYINKIHQRSLVLLLQSPTLIRLQLFNALIGGIIGGLLVGIIVYQLYKKNNKYMLEKFDAIIQKINKKNFIKDRCALLKFNLGKVAIT